jgi:glucokinase
VTGSIPETGASGEVLALDIGGTKLAAGIVGGDGRLREHNVLATERTGGAEAALDRALGLVEALLGSEHRAGRAPQALGVSTNGLTREEGVDLAPAVSGWEKLKIPAELRRRFPGLPTTIVNDLKAATAAEMRWGALRGVSEGLYVNLGTGFGAGVVSAGRLVDGAHGAAGEIGYIVPSLGALAERKPRQAVLEERIGGRGVEIWSEAELGRSVTAAELLELSRTDARARELQERLFDEIALWVANATLLMDPSHVVVGGGMVRSSTELFRRIERTVSEVAPFPAEVRLAHFGAESALLGAGAVAFAGAGRPDPGAGRPDPGAGRPNPGAGRPAPYPGAQSGQLDLDPGPGKRADDLV